MPEIGAWLSLNHIRLFSYVIKSIVSPGQAALRETLNTDSDLRLRAVIRDRRTRRKRDKMADRKRL